MKMKSIFTSALSIALVALVLWGAGMGLSKMEAENSEKEFYRMLSTILPGSSHFEKEVYEGEDEAIQAVYKGETGFVIETVTAGYAGDITVLVGVSVEGTVTGLVVRNLSETYGLGANALSDKAFLAQFLETSGDAAVGTNVDAMTGATVSSKAITKAVNSAVAYVTGADITSSATEWGG